MGGGSFTESGGALGRSRAGGNPRQPSVRARGSPRWVRQFGSGCTGLGPWGDGAGHPIRGQWGQSSTPVFHQVSPRSWKLILQLGYYKIEILMKSNVHNNELSTNLGTS